MNEQQPDAYKNYVRQCLSVFVVVLCGTAALVAASVMHVGSPGVSIVYYLPAAFVNAVLVGGFLIHLFSEKKMIYVVLAFTVFFFTGLMFLTLLAHADVPTALAH